MPASASNVYSAQLRSSQSQPRAGMYHNLHETGTGMFVRPSTPAPHGSDREREREKRGSTVESDADREREIEVYRGRSKRSRLRFGDVEMDVRHSLRSS